jgi:hypothetical protein
MYTDFTETTWTIEAMEKLIEENKIMNNYK